jgi:mevalonate kinase
MDATGRASGKVILFGEHVVVYGRPAIAAGLPIGLEVRVMDGDGPSVVSDDPTVASDPRPQRLVAEAAALADVDPRRVVVRVRSDLPAGRGFGSSAALAVATLRALFDATGRMLPLATALEWGRRLEALFHGTSSGIDPAAAALGSCFRFVRGEPPRVTPVELATPLPLVVAYGSRPRSTGQAVGGLRARWEADRERHEALFDAVAGVVERGEAAMRGGDLGALGQAFDHNQALLESLGVSSDETTTLVAAARRAGAFGAKLTGGGAGGAVIALAAEPESLAARLEHEGWRTTVTRIVSHAARPELEE